MQSSSAYGQSAKFDPPNDGGGEDYFVDNDSSGSFSSCFLMGQPVGHSLSPLIHNTAFSLLDVGGHYSAHDVDPSSVASAVASIDGTTVIGANVTIPYKQAVIPFLDELTPIAQEAGAVNTIFRRKGRLIGENTDVEGFLAPLEALRYSSSRLTGASTVALLPSHPRVLILGSGGAARAVALASRMHLGTSRIRITARNRATARAIPYGEAIDWEDRKIAAEEADLIVNATPIGMVPSTQASPLPDDVEFRENQIVYDLIYNPDPTMLLRRAAKDGATTIGGLPMLLGQAAAAFKIWTGQEMPIVEVEKVVREALRTRLSS